jgi:hypothetical protein
VRRVASASLWTFTRTRDTTLVLSSRYDVHVRSVFLQTMVYTRSMIIASTYAFHSTGQFMRRLYFDSMGKMQAAHA